MRSWTGKILIGLAGCLLAYGLIAQFAYHDFKDFGSILIATFFLGLAGWLIGDF